MQCPNTHTMKLASEYLSDAAKFDRLADAESDPKLKEQLTKQAAAHRKLAADRAKALGIGPGGVPS
jgi:hypothetical protein